MESSTPGSPAAHPPRRKSPHWVNVALLLGLAGVIYNGVLDFGFFPHWDDSLYLLDRPEVTDWFQAGWTDRLLTPAVGYPLPIPTFLHYLTRQAPPDWVVPAAHLLSLAFHLANVVLVYLLGLRWLRGTKAAVAASALWASHPLLVESVAWATNLKTVAFGTFFLGALWVWDRHLERPRRRLAVAACVLVVLALGCRPGAIVAAPLWLALAALRDPDRLRRPQVWAPIALAALLAVAYLPLAVSGHDQLMATGDPHNVTGLPLGETLRRVPVALGLQLRHVVAPFDLHPIYQSVYPEAPRDFWLGILLGGGLLVATVVAIRRRSTSSTGLLLWWVTYLPASGLTFLPRFTADTYMYLPLAGLTLAGVAASVELTRPPRERYRRLLGIFAVVVVLGAGTIATLQTQRWRNELALWLPVVEAQPDNPKAFWQLGAAYASVGEWERAAEVYRAGYPAFERRNRIPMQMVEALRRTDRPQEAARVAAEIILYDGLKHPAAPENLMRLATRPEVSLAELPRVRAAVQQLVADRQAVAELEADTATALAQKLIDTDMDTSAKALLGETVRLYRDHCPAWELLEHLESDRPIEPPADCLR